MQIHQTLRGDELTLALEGRLDTLSAPDLDASLKNSLEGVRTLILDFSMLEYVSSAGLRVLLTAHKRMSQHGSMTIRNVNAGIMEIFDMTGFAGVLHIEEEASA